LTAPGHFTVVYLVTSSISARFFDGQLAYIQAQGFDVVVGCGVTQHAAQTPFDAGVKVVDLGFTRSVSPLRDLVAIGRTIRMLRRVRPAIVNYSTPKAALLGALAAKLAGVPTRVYVVRGLRYQTMTGWPRRVLTAFERLICKLSTVVVMNSRSVIEAAATDGIVDAGRCQILHHGSGNGIAFDALPTVDRDQSRVELGLQPDSFVLGFVGRLTRDKGISDILEAMGRLDSDSELNIELVLAGDYELGDPVADSVRQSIAAHPRVHHLGWVKDPSVVHAAMDVLAFPSYREGLPNVVLEAQLRGKPVVGYRATGTVDAMLEGTTGLLVDIGDVGALSSAIAVLVKDPELCDRLGRAGREFVRTHFAQTDVWGDLAGLYRRSLAET